MTPSFCRCIKLVQLQMMYLVHYITNIFKNAIINVNKLFGAYTAKPENGCLIKINHSDFSNAQLIRSCNCRGKNLRFVRGKNLPYSLADVKKTCLDCKTCAEVKPRFFRKQTQTLINATQPWQKISLDFKGPDKRKNKYLLIVIDEFSRFPFVFPCQTMTTQTVIKCLTTLFCMFGLPGYVHTDRASYFLSKDFKDYLHNRGIVTSRTTPYHPTGNSQNERWNQTIWRTVKLMLHSRQLPEEAWETVLQDALHSTRSLLCTSTNSTPHDRFFSFQRKSMLGQSLPHRLITPGPVLLRNHVRNKGDPLCYEVDFLESNQQFTQVRFPDGRESTVSTKDLAPYPSTKEPTRISHEEQPSSPNSLDPPDQSLDNINLTPPDNPHPSSPLPLPCPQPSQTSPTPLSLPSPQPSETPTLPVPSPRRSTRARKAPNRYGDPVCY